jgi:hypothetical protein
MTRNLPDANAPLVVSDGVAIAPTASHGFARIEVPSNSKAQRLVTGTRRKLLDLPLPTKQMNSFAVVLVYTASGLSDSEIALATKLSIEQIAHIRKQAAYQQLEEYVTSAVMEQSKNDVAAILAEKEVKAAEKIGDLVESLDEKVALAASKDILDRRGHTPKQQIDLRAEMLNTFRIEYVDKRGEPPVIDMEADDGNSA